MNSRHGDILFGAATVLFASFIYLESIQLPTDTGGFSKLVSWILGGAGAVLFLKTFRRTETATRLFSDFQWTIFFTSVALWILAIFLTPFVGFFVTAAVFLFLSSWLLLGQPRQIGALFKNALFAVATTVVLWFLFKQTLQLSMPEGLFF
jgi:hypothetical protein